MESKSSMDPLIQWDTVNEFLDLVRIQHWCRDKLRGILDVLLKLSFSGRKRGKIIEGELHKKRIEPIDFRFINHLIGCELNSFQVSLQLLFVVVLITEATALILDSRLSICCLVGQEVIQLIC